MSDTPSYLPALRRPELTANVFNMALGLAPTIHASRLFPGVSSPEQAAAIMLKGYELGFGLTAAFDYLESVQGRVGLKPTGMLALIHRSRLIDMTVESSNTKATVSMKRRDTGFAFSLTYTLDDAKKAGLVKTGGNWEKYPANMLRYRAVKFCAMIVCPDILGGLYTTDELGGVLPVGADPLTGEVIVQEAEAQP